MAMDTTPWDPADRLATPAHVAGYLEAAFEDGDPSVICAALGDVARARGMTDIARETGLSRESLYRALSPEGQPEFATILKVLRVLGLRISAARIAEPNGRMRKKSSSPRPKKVAA